MSEDDALQAGELAIGVLDGDERAAALRRVLAEPAFAVQVARWRERLAALIAAIPAVEPPAEVERAILAATRSDRQTAGRWRLTAITASAIAACLAVVMVWFGRPAAPVVQSAPAKLLVAALAGTEGNKPFTAVYDPHAGQVAIVGAAPWPQHRSAELWAIAPGNTPQPLGLLGRGGRSDVVVAGSARALMAAGVTLAISIEPDGGSPTRLPTGPVVASGGLVSG